MSIESKVYLDLARIWNVGPGEVEKMVRDYIGAVTCNFKPLQTYPKPHICIRPIKVKTLKQRLEEATMHEDCYFCIKRDICTKDVPKPCNYKYTEDERKAAQASDQYGAILNDTYLPNAYRKKNKEETKMNATSTENFHDVIAIDLELQTFPNPDVQDKFIVSATNRDDIFCFVFEGPHIEDACRKAGLFTGWEKDQKIRELEEELGRWKKEAADCLRLRDEAQKEAYKLKKEKEKYEEKIKKLEHDDMLDKNAADYWSKEHDILLERFAKLQVENEKLKDKLENVEPFRSLERTIKEKQRLREEYEEKIDDLQRKYDLEKAANEAQRKFIKEYAGNDTEVTFNYAIGSGPITYGLYDKDYIDKLRKEIHDLIAENTELKTKLHDTAKEGDYIMYNGSPYTPSDIERLLTGIRQLEELKTPAIENFTDEEPSSRADILDCAKKCVCGQREQDYGTPESNFQLIADLWNGYLGFMDHPQDQIKAKDVAMMMALMKIARIRNGGGSGDSFVDLAGYAACGGEIWASNKGTNGDSN